MRDRARRPLSFYLLAAFFGLFVLFLYGPTSTIVILSFQGPSGGLTFPMNGVSFHWFGNLFERQMVGDFAGSLQRSMLLGIATMLVTVAVSFAAGLAFRKRFKGATLVFYLAIASLIVPSILISLGIGLLFRVLEWDPAWYSSAFGAHLSWTLPFGLLIMFAVFNRFDRAYEEAARDLGATPWQTLLAATKHGATVCGAGDDLGTVEVGKLADLIVVRANPLDDINNVRQLLLVLKEGRVVSDKRAPVHGSARTGLDPGGL